MPDDDEPMLVQLEDAQPGSTLAADVVDSRGGTLMRAEQILEPRHIEVLRRRGVKTVLLRPSPADAAPAAASEPSSPSPSENLARLERMFAPHADNPLMAELRRIAFAAAARPRTPMPP